MRVAGWLVIVGLYAAIIGVAGLYAKQAIRELAEAMKERDDLHPPTRRR